MIEADCAMFCVIVTEERRGFVASTRWTPRHRNEETQHRTRNETARGIKRNIG